MVFFSKTMAMMMLFGVSMVIMQNHVEAVPPGPEEMKAVTPGPKEGPGDMNPSEPPADGKKESKDRLKSGGDPKMAGGKKDDASTSATISDQEKLELENLLLWFSENAERIVLKKTNPTKGKKSSKAEKKKANR